MESKRKRERKERKLKKSTALFNLIKSNSRESQSLESQQIEIQSLDMETEEKKAESACKNGDNTQKADMESSERREKMSFSEMKQALRERNKMSMQRPKVFLTPDEMLPYKSSSEGCDAVLPPLYSTDLQHLLLYTLQGNISSFKPRWCKLLRVTKVSSVVMILLDGIGYTDFFDDKDNFKFIEQSFQIHLEMICPDQYCSSIDSEIYSVPLSISQVKKANVKVHDDIRSQVVAKIEPVKKLSGDNTGLSSDDKFSRTCLLLSSNQMKLQGYPMPVETGNDQYKDFVFSQLHYGDVNSNSPLFAVDCEMCFTTIRKNELTRVSIVAENGETVYDTLVKPRNKIINYLTRYSGITKEMLEPIDTRLEDVQKDIQNLLPSDAILCGQSLNCDLLALKLFHPYVIDTSVIFNLSGNKHAKSGLKKLTSFFLNRTIQNSQAGHCSTEDAIASLDLVKLKLSKGLEFGDATINGIYFPNIQTYFLGKMEGKSEKVENVEQEGSGAAVCLKRPNSFSERSDPKKLKTSGNKVTLNSKNETLDATSFGNRTQQMAIFHQNKSMHINQSIFKLIEEAGRSGSLIGHDSFTYKYEKEPIEIKTVPSDKEACEVAMTSVQSKDFTWVNLRSFREAVYDEEMTLKSVKRKLDRRVKKIINECKEKSLVLVVMGGRRINQKVTNAGVFLKIT